MKTILNWEQFNEKKSKKDYLDPKDTFKKPLKKEAAYRHKGDVVFPAECKCVKKDVKEHPPKDHFPINSIKQARNALARASQYKEAPAWFNGSLEKLVKMVHDAVTTKYPSIKATEKSEKPGKG